MDQSNASVLLETTRDFQRCCSFSYRTRFELNGEGVIQIIICILTVPTSLSATLGNLLVLISIWRTPSLHSPSNILLVGLALSDLGVGLVVQPIFFVYNIAKIKRLACVFCNSFSVFSIAAVLLCLASLFTVTATSLDMYIALYLHLRYKEIVTVKRITVILATVWVFSVACSMLNKWCPSISNIILMSAVALCLLITTSAYYKVCWMVRRHRIQIDVQVQVGQLDYQEAENVVNMARHRKSLTNFLVIYCLFVLCYLPYVVMNVVIATTGRNESKQSLYELSGLIVFLNSTLNPFVFCWRFQQIRVAVIATTKRIFRRNSNQ